MKALKGIIDGDIAREEEIELTEADPLYWLEVLDQADEHDRIANQQQKYASTQVNLPQLEDELDALHEQISDADILKLEAEPHVTVRYGLLTDDPDEVAPIIKGYGAIEMKFGQLSLFTSAEHDVLKYTVYSYDLHQLNRLLGTLPNNQLHAEYQPHLTVAYLKPGTGAKYLNLTSTLAGMKVEAQGVHFSTPEREQTQLALNVFCPTGPGGGIDPTCSPGGTSAGASDPSNFTSGDALAKYVEGNAKFTKLQLDKLRALNPNGIQDGKFFYPRAKAKMAEQIEWLKANLPEGTTIVVKASTAAQLGITKTFGTGEAFEGTFKTETAAEVATETGSTYTVGDWQQHYSQETIAHFTPVTQTPVGLNIKNPPSLPIPPTFYDKTYAEANSAVAQQLYAAAQQGPEALAEASKPLLPQLMGSQKLQQYLGSLQTTTAKIVQVTEANAKMVADAEAGNLPTVLSVKFADDQMYDATAHEAWRATLSTRERNAISHWKGGNQRTMREEIAQGNPGTYARAFLKATERQEAYEGVVYRGVYNKSSSEAYATSTFNQIKDAGVGGVWIDNAPHCTSIDSDIGYSFSQKGYDGGLLFRIVTRSGSPIHREDGYVGEREIVGRAGSRYRIVGIYENIQSQHGTLQRFVDLVEEPPL